MTNGPDGIKAIVLHLLHVLGVDNIFGMEGGRIQEIIRIGYYLDVYDTIGLREGSGD